MKADAIAKKIIDDARAQAAVTLADANERAEQYKGRMDKETEQRRADAMKQAQVDCGELRERMLRMAELDQKKAQLAVKRELIDQAFGAALQKLQSMDVASKTVYFEKLIEENAMGDEELVVSAKDAEIFTPGCLARINARLKGAGKPGAITLSPDRRETGGGFILKKSGKEVNCTFAAMISQIRPSLEAQVAQTLFGDLR